MKKTMNLIAGILMLIALMSSASYTQTQNQTNAKSKHGIGDGTVTIQAGAPLVQGSGTIGRIPKWINFTGTNFVLGDSVITESNGNIGIGTTMPASKLTVAGMIETTLGGLKFPDGTVQTTAFSPNQVVRSLNGLTGDVTLAATSPISITQLGNTLTIASPNSLTSVAHNSTLTGTGTSVSPLGVANGGIGNAQLADNSVSLSKIAPNQVVTTLNSLTDNVTLAGGSNITINKSGNTLTIDGSVGSSKAYHAHNGGSGNLNNPGLDVISKEVPAGSYIIFFRAQMFGNDTGGDQNVQCTLSTGDTAGIRLGNQAAVNMGMLVLQDAATFSTTTTITVHCAGFKVASFGNVLTALKVDSIQ